MLFVFNGCFVSISFKSTFISPNGILNDCMFYEGQLILERVCKCFCICFIALLPPLFSLNVSDGMNAENFVIAVRRITVLDCTCTEESEPSGVDAHFLLSYLFYSWLSLFLVVQF